jgi:hypothetical protein
MAGSVHKLWKAAGLAVALERIGEFHDTGQYLQVLRVKLLGLTFDAQCPHVIVLEWMEAPPLVQAQSQWVRRAFVWRE